MCHQEGDELSGLCLEKGHISHVVNVVESFVGGSHPDFQVLTGLLDVELVVRCGPRQGGYDCPKG